MAFGWISAFKAIPWSELIAATPVITQGAKKLWEQVGKTRTVAKKKEPAVNRTQPVSSIDQRLDEMTTRIEQLEEEQKLSSEIISGLAEQNKQLIGAINVLNQRQKWLVAIVIGSIAIMLILANNQWHLV